jgi:hypothetical protein
MMNYVPFIDDPPYHNAVRQDWWPRHVAAVKQPRTLLENDESVIVDVAGAIRATVIAYTGDGQPADYVIGPSIGYLLAGFVGLLNGNLGRLDGGTCDSWARTMADRVGWCMDHESMTSECARHHTESVVVYRDQGPD